MAEAGERRALRMHPRLLWDVIHRQAGSLSKSVLEGVMNSIDAAGSRCDITLDQRRLVIEDDGKGFADHREIQDFFETFGYPHKQGDATYGRFRMGRGQLFAAGRNTWTTNRFVMDVDLKPQGDDDSDDFQLGYTLREVSPGEARTGCRIEVELYDPMNRWLLAETERSIREAVAWAQVPVTLNGTLVSKPPREGTWTRETDDAYILLRKAGSLAVYNLGVLVCHVPASKFGTGGVVVSKRKLDVNFARNAVQSTCPEWARISRTLATEADRKVEKAQKLDDAGRERLARELMDGARPMAGTLSQRLVTDVTGSHRQLGNIVPKGWSRTTIPVTAAPTGDRIGDKVMQRKLAMVLSTETLDRFGVTDVPAFIERLREVARNDLAARGEPMEWVNPRKPRDPVEQFLNGLAYLEPVDFERFRRTFTETHDSVDAATMTKGETAALRAVDEAARGVHRTMEAWCRDQNHPVPSARSILAGRSDTAMGWTDGERNIWIERSQLPKVRSPEGRLGLAALLVHEFLHREPDTATHVHDVDFYQLYHDITMHTAVLATAAAAIENGLARQAKLADRFAKVDAPRVADELDAAAEAGARMAPTP